jgi:L-fuculose-phosphate aldolase
VADIDQLKQQVSQSCRIMGKENMTREPAGHVSARIPGSDRIVIKARGAGEAALRYTMPEDLIILDMDGKKIEGRSDLTAPAETRIHTALYRARPEINCVIHVHPPTVVLFTIVGRELLPIFGAFDPAGLQLVLDGIPEFPRSHTITTEEHGRALIEVMGSKDVCVMRGHGITACGTSVPEATVTAWHLDGLAEMNYRAALLGTPRPIPDEDLERARIRRRPTGGRVREGAEASPPEEGDSTWKYLVKWIEE